MQVLICFLNLILLFVLNYLTDLSEGYITRIREAVNKTALFFSGFVFVQIEVLSALNYITFSGILFSNIFLFVLLIYLINRKKALFRFPELKVSEYKGIIIIIFLFIVLPLIYLCLFVPPNNCDSATCYLIRVETWIQNHNILPYPTENIYEVYYNQFPQFFILNTRILSGSDYFTSIFQLFAFAGCISTTSLIAKELGGTNPKTQLLSGVLCFSLPQAILQSTASMYDLQSAFFCSIAMLYLISLLKNQAADFNKNCVLFALAFAFTSFTKYTAVLFLIIAGLIVLIKLIKTPGKFARFSLTTLIIFLLIHSQFFYQNYSSIGNPVSPGKEFVQADHLLTENPSLKDIFSSVMKNTVINLSTPFSAVNSKLYNVVVRVHQWIGNDINSPAVNLRREYEKYPAVFSETTTGNFILTILFFISVIICIKKLISGRSLTVLASAYMISIIFGFIIFCCLFKFQEWNARLQLPFFVLATAPVSIFISDIIAERKKGFKIIIVLLTLSSLPVIYLNYSKPLISYSAIRKIINIPPSKINSREIKSSVDSLKVSEFYEADLNSDFLRIKKDISSGQKRKVFNVLGSIGYFKNESSVFEKSRDENYLAPGYLNSALLLSSFEKAVTFIYNSNKPDQRIGLALGHEAVYPLLAMLREHQKHNIIPWQNIKYTVLKNENRNFNRSVNYNLIITNDSTFSNRISSRIKNIHQFDLITLIELSEADTVQYRVSGNW